MLTQDESPQPDGINDSDSNYRGDVESLSCDSAEPTSDSEDHLSEMLSKGNCKRAASCRGDIIIIEPCAKVPSQNISLSDLV